jgi:hypothetical protein
MRDECIQAVSTALGRALSSQEAQNIEKYIRKNRDLARKNLLESGEALTPQSMLEESQRLALEQIKADVATKKLRIAQAVQAHDRIENYLSKWAGNKLNGLKRLVGFDGDARSKGLSVESQAHAINDEAIGGIRETLEATNPKFFGLIEDMNGVRLLMREMRGESTGNADAAAGAKAWKEWTERLRQRMNRAGGHIGLLEDWGSPQHHSQLKVGKAGVDAKGDVLPVANNKWIRDILPILDRERYVNEDGSLMTDPQLTDLLFEMWRTLSQGGVNKIEPGVPSGNGMRANFGSESRSIHFKDADSWIAYQMKYGEKGFYEIMTDHVSSLSKSIALVETFGPNANHTYAYFRDRALKEEAEAKPTQSGKLEGQASKMDNLYNYVAGHTMPVANERLARTFDNIRNWMVTSRLGSAFISSIPDESIMHLTAHVNNLPHMALFRNELATLNPMNADELRLAQRAGLSVETLVHDLNRFGQEALGNSFSSKMANVTIKASLLSKVTAARKRAFGVTMMDSIGHLVKNKEFSELDPQDHRILLSKGVTEQDWAVWKLAKSEQWGEHNNSVLTPESIRNIKPSEMQAILGSDVDYVRVKDQAVTRLLGSILEEVDMAVITPGAVEREAMGAGLQRGTWKGELTRSVLLFKSFPVAMIYRHFSRGMGMETAGGKAAYLASLIAGTTILGAVSQQITEVINGRDPKEMNFADNPSLAGKFWVQALMKGGSLGLYGDFLYSQATQNKGTALGALAGPVFGMVEEMIGLTQGNLIELAQGQETHFGAELVKLIKGNTPLASLWYAKAALDHMVFQQLQEFVSPGYNQEVQRRRMKEFNQEDWWDQGEMLPYRAPDLDNVSPFE